MRTIPLQSTPNQQVTLSIDGVRMVLTLKETRGVMSADLSRAGVDIITGCRVVAGEPIIPYDYLEAGNFLILTLSDALPDWNEFGATQELVYLTQDEMDAIRG